jgi:hypothetical protein
MVSQMSKYYVQTVDGTLIGEAYSFRHAVTIRNNLLAKCRAVGRPYPIIQFKTEDDMNCTHNNYFKDSEDKAPDYDEYSWLTKSSYDNKIR